MSETMKDITAVAMAIIGVAIVAVLVSGNSNTVGVVSGLSHGFAGVLGTAMSPVTGAQNSAYGYAS
jgi:hypothetical protein